LVGCWKTKFEIRFFCFHFHLQRPKKQQIDFIIVAFLQISSKKKKKKMLLPFLASFFGLALLHPTRPTTSSPISAQFR